MRPSIEELEEQARTATDRLEARKIRNRISAQKSRDKKRFESDKLVSSVEDCRTENQKLRSELEERLSELVQLKNILCSSMCSGCRTGLVTAML